MRHDTSCAIMLNVLPEQLTIVNTQYAAMEALESCLE